MWSGHLFSQLSPCEVTGIWPHSSNGGHISCQEAFAGHSNFPPLGALAVASLTGATFFLNSFSEICPHLL